MNKIKKWINEHQDEIIFYGYIGFVAILIVIFVGRFVTIINSDIPSWMKWVLLLR